MRPCKQFEIMLVMLFITSVDFTLIAFYCQALPTKLSFSIMLACRLVMSQTLTHER